MHAHRAVTSAGIIIHHPDREDMMSKLRLNLDDLAVDTFHTAAGGGAWKGTVNAHGAETLKTLCASLLASHPTCCPCTPMI
jgi:hypothetical protein